MTTAIEILRISGACAGAITWVGTPARARLAAAAPAMARELLRLMDVVCEEDHASISAILVFAGVLDGKSKGI